MARSFAARVSDPVLAGIVVPEVNLDILLLARLKRHSFPVVCSPERDACLVFLFIHQGFFRNLDSAGLGFLANDRDGIDERRLLEGGSLGFRHQVYHQA